MKLTFESDTLTEAEQRTLYLHLKAKYEPETMVAVGDEFKKELLLVKRVEDVGFSSRVKLALLFKRINTISDLCKTTRSDLKDLPNLGEKSCEEIESVLKRMGLELAG